MKKNFEVKSAFSRAVGFMHWAKEIPGVTLRSKFFFFAENHIFLQSDTPSI